MKNNYTLYLAGVLSEYDGNTEAEAAAAQKAAYQAQLAKRGIAPASPPPQDNPAANPQPYEEKFPTYAKLFDILQDGNLARELAQMRREGKDMNPLITLLKKTELV